MTSERVAVYILSYRRLDYLREAIESVLAQQGVEFDIIVSENSPDENVYESICSYENLHSNFKIIRRRPSLPALEHINTVLDEAKQNYKFAMLFHDDDVMRPGCLEKLYRSLKESPSCSAAACNAYILKQNNPTHRLFNPYLTQTVNIGSVHELIKRYLSPRLSHTPFPTYLYRTSSLGPHLEKSDGGKHSDVSFLVKLLHTDGHFCWLSEPLIYYRQHDLNDSATTDLKDILSLSYFYLKISPQNLFLILVFIGKQTIKKLLGALIKLFKNY